MNADEFEKLFEETVDTCRQVLIVKAKEYATDENRLHNFYVASEFLGVTPQQAAWYFATKHLVSITDMIQKGDNIFPEAVWDEKIGDALNYLILIRAIIQDY